MKTVLLLGGPAAGQRVEVHGTMPAWCLGDAIYKVVPLCSHGEVHWFGILPGADPLALLIAGYAAPTPFRKLSMPNGDAELLESIHLKGAAPAINHCEHDFRSNSLATPYRCAKCGEPRGIYS